MTDGTELASIADELESALTDLGTELDDLRERIGDDALAPGEGPLAKAFVVSRRLSALSQAAK